MKISTKIILTLLAAASLNAFAKETNLYVPGGADRAADAKSWAANKKYGPWGKVNSDSVSKKGSIELSFPKGWYRITGGGLIPVDPANVYKVKLAVKGQKGLKMRFGLMFYDKNKKIIDVMDYAPVNAPVYTLAKAAKKGDKTLTLNQKVNYIHHWAVAFNAKADGSDIPNREHCNLKPSRKWTAKSATLELAQPLKKNYAKGTVVRLQKRHELIFRNLELTGNWKTYTFRTINNRAIRQATKYVSIYLQSGFSAPQKILIDSVSVEKVPAK